MLLNVVARLCNSGQLLEKVLVAKRIPRSINVCGRFRARPLETLGCGPRAVKANANPWGGNKPADFLPRTEAEGTHEECVWRVLRLRSHRSSLGLGTVVKELLTWCKVIPDMP